MDSSGDHPKEQEAKNPVSEISTDPIPPAQLAESLPEYDSRAQRTALCLSRSSIRLPGNYES